MFVDRCDKRASAIQFQKLLPWNVCGVSASKCVAFFSPFFFSLICWFTSRDTDDTLRTDTRADTNNPYFNPSCSWRWKRIPIISNRLDEQSVIIVVLTSAPIVNDFGSTINVENDLVTLGFSSASPAFETFDSSVIRCWCNDSKSASIISLFRSLWQQFIDWIVLLLLLWSFCCIANNVDGDAIDWTDWCFVSTWFIFIVSMLFFSNWFSDSWRKSVKCVKFIASTLYLMWLLSLIRRTFDAVSIRRGHFDCSELDSSSDDSMSIILHWKFSLHSQKLHTQTQFARTTIRNKTTKWINFHSRSTNSTTMSARLANKFACWNLKNKIYTQI